MVGILPEKIRLRQDKIGFGTPQDEWFREPKFQNLIQGILCSESFRSRNLIVPEKAMKIYKAHLSKRGNYSKEIWKWIHLELWYREFFD
jgi:asparagine synthase (glutamine-hydrolysing)